MSTSTEAIREQLVAGNPEYQRLREQHALYVAQLNELSSRHYLTEQEQLDEVRLKKLKLRAKDEMEQLMRHAGNA